jgi:hypothetical protein
MSRDPARYGLRPYWTHRGYRVTPGPEHCDAVHILGYGSEEELKYCMSLWRQWHPELFEEKA